MSLIGKPYDRRSIQASKIELRAEGGVNVIEGLVVPFRARSVDLGGFTEEFRGVSPADNVFALWAHDAREALGSTDATSLELRVAEEGLHIRLIDPILSAEQLRRIERRVLPNASFGFESPTDEWQNIDGKRHRIVHDARLVEVSIGVAWPAYRQTDITAAQRSLAAVHESEQAALLVGQQNMAMRLRLSTL